MVDKSDIPANWSWGIGERAEHYYDYWAYQEENNYELHMWWDKNHKHGVEVIPINGFDENGDPEYGYPERSRKFHTEEQALEYAIELMEEL